MRRLLIWTFCLTAFLTGYAEKVTEQQALEKAQQFMLGKSFMLPPKARQLKGQSQVADNNAFYIFNVEDNGGFVIVAGDDRLPSILGYSERGSLNSDSVPCNVRSLLDYYKKVVSSLGTSDNSVRSVRQVSKPEVKPLVTTQWDQGAPYNTYCPELNGSRCITGCVATAMAQVINYNRWPQGMTGSVPGYTTEFAGIEMPPLEPTQFVWDNMTSDDVARLMLYCGQSVEMNYGLTDSGAFPQMEPDALVNVFGYSQRAHYVEHASYSEEEWDDLLYNELVEQRPIVFNGFGAGGHTFVVHGYRDGYFYINWGWSGREDGYFLLTGLVTSNGSYINDQSATIGIQPPADNIVGRPKIVVKSLRCDNSKYVRRDEDGSFQISQIIGTLVSDLSKTQNMLVGLGLYSDKGLLKVLCEEEHEFPVGESYLFVQSILIDKDIPDGTYRVVPISKAADDDWIADANSSDYYMEISIDGDWMRIRSFPLSPEDRQMVDGAIVDVDGVFYSLYSVNSKKQASILAIDRQLFKGDVYLPDYVEYQGEQYPLIDSQDTGVFWNIDGLTSFSTSITKFSGIGNCTELRSIELREGVASMDLNAITGCHKLDSVVFPQSLKILWQGVECCNSLKTVRFKNPQQFTFTSVPDWNSGSLPALTDVYFASPDAPLFSFSQYNEVPVNPQVTLHVPKGCKSNYEANGWSGWKIQEDQPVPESEGIEWGYCIGNQVTDWGYNFEGGNNKVECAIRVPAEMMAPYKGLTVNKVQVYQAFVEFDYVFITQPGVDYLVKQDCHGSQTSWLEVELSEPYTITGEEFYVGVGRAGMNGIFFANEESRSPDGFWMRWLGSDTSGGWTLGTWQNQAPYVDNLSLPIRFQISGQDIPNDIWVNDVTIDPDYEQVTVQANVVSRTKDPIKNYTLQWNIDGKENGSQTIETLLFPGHSEKISFNIPVNLVGVEHDFNYSVSVVNGQPDAVDVNSTGTVHFRSRSNTFYPRKIVMEEGTGTWCGWCVRGIETIERLSRDYPDNFIAIALHTSDEMDNAMNYKAIVDRFNSFPGCLINRTISGDPDYPQMIPLIEDMKDKADAMIKMSAHYASSDSSAVSVSTETVFGFTDDGSTDYRIAYVVVEDHVGPYVQKNYYSGGTPDANSEYMSEWMKMGAKVEIEFNDVARGIFGGTDGLEGSIPKGIKEGDVYQYTYTFSLPSNIQDKKNISIIALLLDHRSGTIINADKCSLSVLRGDANGDNVVNAADIVEVVNYIMGSPSASFDEKAADVNGDGVVNAADIVLIVNIIMGQ